MFKKQIAIVLGSCILLSIIYGLSLISLSPDVRQQYRQLMEPAASKQKASKREKYHTQQKRHEVSKQMIFQGLGERRPEIRLKSQYSEIEFDHRQDKAELVEHFQRISCSMQEELLEDPTGVIPPRQMIRSIQAEQAHYHYHTSELTAQQAILSRYDLPGQELPPSLSEFTPLMTGYAEEIEMSLLDQSPYFKAKGFRVLVQGESAL
jgi:flagellar biosynthesis component FlhA